MNSVVAVYDSCVLYPAPLRDLLIHLAMTDLFKAKWTEDIHQEWMRNVLKDRQDLSATQLLRTRDLMNSHVRDCLVKDYHSLIESLKLPDENDRHVLGAAIHCSANTIVTFNLKDFPKSELSKYNIVAQHPDDFIVQFFDIAAGIICGAIKRLRSTLKYPPIDAEKYLQTIRKQSLPKTAAKLNEFLMLI